MSEDELNRIEKKIASELEPFITGIFSMDAESRNFELFKQAYSDFIPRLLRSMKIFDFITRDFGETTNFLAKEEIHWLFGYLGLVESLGNSIVDMVVMLLVANGRDFHIESLRRVPRIRHVTSIEDLEKERVSLGTKLRFLEDNGIEKLASVVDSDLRNRIAHLNFDVKEDRVYIKGESAVLVIGIGLKKLIRAFKTVSGLIAQLAKDMGLTPRIEVR